MYRTELMNEILKSEEANKIIEMLSPIYGEAYVGLWLIEVIGRELDNIKNWSETYALQVIPNTATWSIPYWEKAYGIVPDASWSMEQRRNNLVSTVKYRAPMNKATLEKNLSNILNLPVEVDEYAGKNKFAVYVKGFTPDTKRAIDFIEKAKPAHMIYDFNTADYMDAEIESYYAIKTTVHETVNITVI